MRHLRSDYNAIQPFPVKREHYVKIDGELHGPMDEWPSNPKPQPLIPDDEPVFVLRGQDPAAPTAVRAWATMLAALGGDDALIQAAYGWADEMEAYGKVVQHGPPDVPPSVLPEG